MTEIIEKPSLPLEIAPDPEKPILPATDMIRVAHDIQLAWADDQRYIDSYPNVRAQITEIVRAILTNEISTGEGNEILTALVLEQQMAGEKDPLTNAYSRRAGELLLEQAIINSRRTGKPLTVLMLDLDKFHDINEKIDHDGGDAVLKATSENAQSYVRRESDFFIRWGGEEFVLIAQGTSEEGIRGIAEEIRATTPAVVGEAISSQGYELGRDVTFSGGLSTITVEKEDQRKPEDIWPELVNSADKRLHLAKENGRNQIVGSLEATSLQNNG